MPSAQLRHRRAGALRADEAPHWLLEVAMSHPAMRPRRTRQSDAWRRMVRETRLSPDAFIYPLFAVPGRGVRHPVSSMPGVSQLSVDELAKDAKAVAATGVPAVLIFAAPAEKDPRASAALDPKGLAAQA